MNAEQLAEIKARCEAATPGPWTAGSYNPYTSRALVRQTSAAEKINPLGWQVACICREARPGDADFIEHARADIPALLAEVERLRAALEAVEWIEYMASETYCPWCDAFPSAGHGNDCQRQLALGATP